MKKLVMRFSFSDKKRRNAVFIVVRIILRGRLRWIPFLVEDECKYNFSMASAKVRTTTTVDCRQEYIL
jgi:hypothetical protein